MPCHAVSHLSDHALLSAVSALLARERSTTAELLAHLAEVDARKLYLPAGYPSMCAWCVGKLRMSEDAAFKRIRAARTAREFPAIFKSLADGRLNVSAVLLLAPHLAPETSEGLLAAAAHQTNAGVERMLAERFPQPDVPAGLLPVPGPMTAALPEAGPRAHDNRQLAARPVGTASAAPSARVSPLSATRFALQLTIGQHTHDKLRYAQSLLGHAVPSGDLAEVLDRALDQLIERLERGKFATGARSASHRRRQTAAGRHIPVQVRSEVWRRDGGRCTFVSDGGHRCEARSRLEFDHVEPYARGGEATVAGIRLRCRAHNQFEAERAFGAGFMRHKRLAAAEASAAARQARARARAGGREPRAPEAGPAGAMATAPAATHVEEVVPWLRQLGFGFTEARQAATRCEAMPDAPLEARVIEALRHFRVRGARTEPARSNATGAACGAGPGPRATEPATSCRSALAAAGR
jgi:hypothetical protein